MRSIRIYGVVVCNLVNTLGNDDVDCLRMHMGEEGTSVQLFR